MIRFLVSKELWFTILAIVIVSYILGHGSFIDGFGDLANFKQNIEWFLWAYVIHRQHRHHKGLLDLIEVNGDDE